MVRIKNRYFLCELCFENNEIVDGLSKYSIQSAISDQIDEWLGEEGLAKIVISVKYYSPWTGILIIRCPREYHGLLWGVLAMITSIRNRNCFLKVVHLGATIKSVQKIAIINDKKKIQELKSLDINQGSFGLR